MFDKFKSLFAKKRKENEMQIAVPAEKPIRKVEPKRIGQLGEYKIDIQMRQLTKENKYISDLLIENPKSRTGFAQIDHLLITPYGLFVIETKNYHGEIKGHRRDKYWSVNDKFKMYNPFFQNYGHIKAIQTILSSFNDIPFVSMVSFTLRCRFSVDAEFRKIQSNELLVYDVELSQYIQRKLYRLKIENPTPPLSDIDSVYKTIQQANITDVRKRQEHVQMLKTHYGKI